MQQEQQLSTGAIQWMVCIAAAILRAFEVEPSNSMSGIAQTIGVSRTTLYHHLRLAVEALNWVYQSKQHLNHLYSQLHRYQHQYLSVQHQALASQANHSGLLAVVEQSLLSSFKDLKPRWSNSSVKSRPSWSD